MRTTYTTIALLFLLIPVVSLAQSTYLMPIPTNLPQNLGGPTLSSTSVQIDLIVEADTYTPYFYAGRKEPAPGTTIRFVALITSEGTSPSSYSWQVGNQNLTTVGPVLQTTFPRLSNDLRVTVTALDQTGKSLGAATEYIRATDPLTLFYELNELHGTSRVAIGESLALIGNEVTVQAEPYFFGVSSLLSGAAGSWTADNVEVVTNNDWRRASLLRKENNSPTEAKVQLDIRNVRNLSESTTGGFILNL